MTSFLQRSIAEAGDRHKAYRDATSSSLSRGGPPGGSAYPGSTTLGGPFASPETTDAQRQYKAALTGWQFVSLRPIAVKVAEQPFRAGFKASRTTGGKSSPDGKMRTKGYKLLPTWLKQIAEGVEADNEHPLLEKLDAPNDFMTGWAMKYCTSMSMVATGRSFWWLNGDGEEMQVFYLPTHWVTAIHTEDRPLVGFRVRPPGVEESKAWDVPFEDMCYFTMPDPMDPVGGLSWVQTQARAINTDDEIQKAQFASMVNGVFPGVVVRAGRLPPPPGQTGQGPLPSLTPEQRQQLTSAIRMSMAGAMHMRDPIIVDAMIEGIEPYGLTSADLDFPNGSKITKERIMQGIGTSPTVAGQTEGSNRASSFVAHEGFYSLSVNPIIEQISQVATNRFSSRYTAKGSGSKLYVWIEKAEAFDADLANQKMTVGIEAKVVKVDEVREFLDLPLLGGEEGEKMVGQAEMEAGQQHEAEMAAMKPPPMAGPQRPGQPGQPGQPPKKKPLPKEVRRLRRKLAVLQQKMGGVSADSPQALDFFVEGLKSALS